MKIETTDALIVTDVQNDFCPGGALPIEEGHRIVPIINQLQPLFEHIVFTRDWHPEDHCSFDDEPEFVDGSWPVHCVADTPGAEFHGDLHVPADAFIVSKATEPEREAYSSFQDTGLADKLREWGVTRVFLTGLATDFCVKFSALDAIEAGFEVCVVENACRGVNHPPGSVARAVDEMRAKGVKICWSGDLE